MKTGVKEIRIKQMPFGQSVIRFKGDDIFSAIPMDGIHWMLLKAMGNAQASLPLYMAIG